MNVAVIPIVDGDLALRNSAELNPLTDAKTITRVADAPAATFIKTGVEAMAKSGAVVGEVKYSAVSEATPVAAIAIVWILLLTLSFHRLKK